MKESSKEDETHKPTNSKANTQAEIDKTVFIQNENEKYSPTSKTDSKEDLVTETYESKSDHEFTKERTPEATYKSNGKTTGRTQQSDQLTGDSSRQKTVRKVSINGSDDNQSQPNEKIN